LPLIPSGGGELGDDQQQPVPDRLSQAGELRDAGRTRAAVLGRSGARFGDQRVRVAEGDDRVSKLFWGLGGNEVAALRDRDHLSGRHCASEDLGVRGSADQIEGADDQERQATHAAEQRPDVDRL
jgi:hypothetical protein